MNLKLKIFLIILTAACTSCASFKFNSNIRLYHPLSSDWVATDEDKNVYVSPGLAKKMKESEKIKKNKINEPRRK